MGYGQVEEEAEVTDGCGSEVAEMVDVEVVRSGGGGCAGLFDGVEDELGGEGHEVAVESLFTYLSFELSLGVVSGRGVASEEAAEGVGDV